MKALLSLLTFCIPAFSLMAGTYANIAVDGSFADWSSIPTIATDVSGDGTPVDFVSLQAANDDDYLYLRFTLNAAPGSALNVGTNQMFIAIDNDNNTATGFDVYGLGAIGSEIGWQNDFPFQQGPGAADFNTGSITGGGAGISGYATDTISQEIRISRAATFTTGGGTIFPNDTIGIAIYSNGTAGDDFIGTGSYTFATIPEPSSVILILSGIISIIGVNRIRRK